MDNYASLINSQYGQLNLIDRIYKALEEIGKDPENLSLDDLAEFDQLHGGQREGTRALASLAGLRPGMKVLDIGSGIGGPARTLASEYGCQVIGIDLTEEYVEAAAALTDKVRLSDKVSFRKGSALHLPFEDEAFDVVWSQNVFMNIEDKATAIREAARVLRPQGILAMEIMLAGGMDGLEYPVLWADTPDISFLTLPDEFRGFMTQAGLSELEWENVTQRALESVRKRRALPPEEQPMLGIDIYTDNVPTKGKNTMRGLEGGQLLDIYAVYRKTP